MLRIFCFLFCFQSLLYTAAQEKADQFYNQAEVFKKNSIRDSAAHYYRIAAWYYLESDSIQKAINAFNMTGVSLTRSDLYDEAKIVLDSALILNQGNSRIDSLNLATTHISLGVVFNAEENYPLSLRHHFTALDIRHNLLGKFHSDVATSYGNIGNVYFNFTKYDSAFYFHSLALEIRDSLFGPKSTEITQSYMTMGNACRELKDYEQALFYFEAALSNKIIQRGETHKDLIPVYEKIIQVALLQNNQSVAEKYQLRLNELRSFLEKN